MLTVKSCTPMSAFGSGDLGLRSSVTKIAVPNAPYTCRATLVSDEARLKLTRDPDLKAPDADPLKLLLYLFERDDAIKLMRAG